MTTEEIEAELEDPRHAWVFACMDELAERLGVDENEYTLYVKELERVVRENGLTDQVEVER